MRECPTVNKLAPERKGLAYTCRRSIGYTRERASRIGLPVERTAEVLGRGGLALDSDRDRLRCRRGGQRLLGCRATRYKRTSASWPRDPQAAVNGAAVPALGTGYRRIFTLKQRELTQTVAWLVDGAEALDRYGVDIPERGPRARPTMLAGRPDYRGQGGPLRADLYARRRRHGGTSRFGLARGAGAHPRLRQSLLPARAPTRTARPRRQVLPRWRSRILEGVDVAVDAGETPCRDASTIVSFQHGGLQILRQGALPASEIERVLSDPMQ